MRKFICFIFLISFFRIGEGEELFREDFEAYPNGLGPNGWLVGEFTYWNGTDAYWGGLGLYWVQLSNAPNYPSQPKWECNSGEIRVINGEGYCSGGQLRLNTRLYDFKDFILKCRLKITGLGGGGVRFFLRHDSQYRLYYLAPFDGEGYADLKKKLQLRILSNGGFPPFDEDDQYPEEGYGNRGLYYYLLPDNTVSTSFTAGVWYDIKIKVEGDPPTFDLWINEEHIFQAQDSSTRALHDRDVDEQLLPDIPVTVPGGAVGLRADGSSFYFDDFIVETIE